MQDPKRPLKIKRLDGGLIISNINPTIIQYCFAERIKAITINLINNIIRYSDTVLSKQPPSQEEIMNWFLNDLARETELAINVSKGVHFEAALTLINEAISKFPRNSEETIKNLREALTKITTQASNAYSKL